MIRTSTLALLAVGIGLCSIAQAKNPIIQTIFTADPAPYVHDGMLYLYTSHDEDKDIGFFNMIDWVAFTTEDMVNWTHRGPVASLRTFPWAAKEISGWGGFENGAWAVQAVERGGKWYLYCPIQGRGIGVLVADNPFGPFKDPLGKPLIGGQFDSIDPTVFIDDNGQAYLYWGNPNLWSVKLNKDMISYDTSVGENGLVRHPMTVEALGKRTREDKKRGTSYEEGPWLYKRGDRYYLFFAGGPIGEHLAYSTGPSAEGPWTYGGVVMTPQSAFTIHPGVVDFKGKTYLFYHNAGLPGGGGFKRSVCVDELKFNPDGSVVKVEATKKGPAPVAALNPYQRVEAETIAWESGIETEACSAGGMDVCDIDDGDFITVGNVDFGSRNPRTFMVSAAAEKPGGSIEVRLDNATGEPIATVPIGPTGGLQKWKQFSALVKNAAGVHDVYFTFKAPDAGHFNFDCWKFQ